MGSDEKQVEIGQRYAEHLAAPTRAALDWVFAEYGIGSDRVTKISVEQGVRGPGEITISLLMTERAPEQLREQASRLLTAANEREGLGSEVFHDVTAVGWPTRRRPRRWPTGGNIAGQHITDLVSEMQNEGILFREREEH